MVGTGRGDTPWKGREDNERNKTRRRKSAGARKKSGHKDYFGLSQNTRSPGIWKTTHNKWTKNAFRSSTPTFSMGSKRTHPKRSAAFFASSCATANASNSFLTNLTRYTIVHHSLTIFPDPTINMK